MRGDANVDGHLGLDSGSPKHVAIVGCGFTGTSILFQLVDGYPVEKITVFEASGVFGPGYAYRTDECQDYLLNNTTDTMCLTPENKGAFINWLRDTGMAGAVNDKGHLPRALYGEFLTDTVRAARTIAAIKGIVIDLVPAEVTSLQERPAGVTLRAEETTVDADVALLTTGRCPDLDRFGGAIKQADPDANFFSTHVSAEALDDIAMEASIYVLGTSLSAYDIVNRLYGPSTGCTFERGNNRSLRYVPGKNQRRILLGSRSGRLKKVQSQRPVAIRRQHFTLSECRHLAAVYDGLSLGILADAIEAEAKAHDAHINWAQLTDPYSDCNDGDSLNRRAAAILAADIKAAKAGDTQNFLVDLCADAQMDIWDGFAERLMQPEAEMRYRQAWETAFLTIAAPCPVSTAERLLALHQAGVLTVRAGITAPTVGKQNAGFTVAHQFGTDTADVVIDATGGVNRDVGAPDQSPLTLQLAQSGVVKSYRLDGQPMPGADVDMQTFRLNGAQNIYALNMWLWGPGYFTSSAFIMASLSRRLLDKLFGERNGHTREQ